MASVINDLFHAEQPMSPIIRGINSIGWLRPVCTKTTAVISNLVTASLLTKRSVNTSLLPKRRVNTSQATKRPLTARKLALICLIMLATITIPLSANTLIDANTASEEQLQSITGIGPATAQKIIQARQKKAFKDLRDFAERVPGVGPKRLQQYSDAGLVVKRVAPMNPTPPAQVSRHYPDPSSTKTAEPEQHVSPSISVIEGGMRESNGKHLIK